jgi:c-di-GMP-binding flagellar brake protein YcgR
MAKGAARRRSPRFATRLPGTLVARANHEVRVLDVSLGGCLVQCAARLDPGAIFDLRLRIGDEDFAAKVRVADASLDGASEGGASYLAGLEFLALPAQQEARLLRFIEGARRKRDADPPAQ